MRMDKSDRENVVKMLGAKIGREKLPCPLCGESRFVSSDTIYELREFKKKNEVPDDRRFTLVYELCCGNCGYSLLFNALQAGIVKQAH